MSRFCTSRGDHCGRPVDAGDFDTLAREKLAVGRVATCDIEHTPDATLQVPLPDAPQEFHLALDIARLFHVDAAEDVGKLVDAAFHADGA